MQMVLLQIVGKNSAMQTGDCGLLIIEENNIATLAVGHQALLLLGDLLQNLGLLELLFFQRGQEDNPPSNTE